MFEGIAKDKSELIYDALGDIQVVLIGLEQQIKNGAQISANQQELELLLSVVSTVSFCNGTTAENCLEEAYEVIKDRKGKMIDGVFVKEEDL